MNKYIQITDKVICIRTTQCVNKEGYFIEKYIKMGEIFNVFGYGGNLLSISADTNGQVRNIVCSDDFSKIQDWREKQLDKLLEQ